MTKKSKVKPLAVGEEPTNLLLALLADALADLTKRGVAQLASATVDDVDVLAIILYNVEVDEDGTLREKVK